MAWDGLGWDGMGEGLGRAHWVGVFGIGDEIPLDSILLHCCVELLVLSIIIIALCHVESILDVCNTKRI